jgi:hypothetical protein
MSIDAMKLALEALEEIADEVFAPYDNKLGDAILALRAAITDYAQTSFDVCGQCGWRTQRPGFECLNCLNCLNADLQAKLNKYMAQEAAREGKK